MKAAAKNTTAVYKKVEILRFTNKSFEARI